ncbi:hypothetical protein ELQ35_18225 [Peribacillus cavernae]|uniref:Copper chaperone n=1 Tax=Peribacillus cavernae TaxID=1674310 RepID=A0A433HEA2_9BACI|nr:hypothetical protein [Peribacillus cavernae]MDQ0219876.1 hypothetical protein [Peribacillus cavernae]RUQ26638.1 hypothetical protein ELQ35_18225 [Peribacillus cavernae]
MDSTTIYVKEAISSGAIQTLESLLLQSEGIERAIVDTDDGEVKVEFDRNKISHDQIILKLEEHGLNVTK